MRKMHGQTTLIGRSVVLFNIVEDLVEYEERMCVLRNAYIKSVDGAVRVK